MMSGECTIITEECVIDMNRAKELLAKRGSPTGGWKSGILFIDSPKEPYQKPITEKGISNSED